jgi:hypothetical protein
MARIRRRRRKKEGIKRWMGKMSKKLQVQITRRPFKQLLSYISSSNVFTQAQAKRVFSPSASFIPGRALTPGIFSLP